MRGRLFQRFFHVVPTVFRAPVVFLMGGPGSGKGTVASRLSGQFNHISTGEYLRELVQMNTHPKVKNFASEMAKGKLIPDRDVIDLLGTHPAFQSEKPIILDGCPRTYQQWLLYRKFGPPRAIIDLVIPEHVMRARLLARSVGGPHKRPDDTREVIERRLKDYFEKIVPDAEKIKGEAGVPVFDVDASGTQEEVYGRIQEIINRRLVLAAPIVNSPMRTAGANPRKITISEPYRSRRC